MRLIYERTPSIERALLVDGERLLELDERFRRSTVGRDDSRSFGRTDSLRHSVPHFCRRTRRPFFCRSPRTLVALDKYPGRADDRAGGACPLEATRASHERGHPRQTP